MVKMTVRYQGEKHCELVHLDSKATIQTDAPKDNHGLGQSFSPTDLMSVSLGACMLTVMAIHAETEGVNLAGSHTIIEKEMNASPRRVGRIGVSLRMPKNISSEWQKKLYEIAMTCPVKLSLHPDIKIDLSMKFDL